MEFSMFSMYHQYISISKTPDAFRQGGGCVCMYVSLCLMSLSYIVVDANTANQHLSFRALPGDGVSASFSRQSNPCSGCRWGPLRVPKTLYVANAHVLVRT